MKRRSFLKLSAALGAGALIPFTPSFPETRSLTIEQLTRALGMFSEPMDGNYYCFLHPTVVRDLRTMAARECWRDAWRRYRIHVSTGGWKSSGPRQILERFGDTNPMPAGELVKLRGFQIIEMARVA